MSGNCIGLHPYGDCEPNEGCNAPADPVGLRVAELNDENLRLREQAGDMAEEIERLQQQVKFLTEEKRQLVVLCEAIGAKARSGEIPRFWEDR